MADRQARDEVPRVLSELTLAEKIFAKASSKEGQRLITEREQQFRESKQKLDFDVAAARNQSATITSRVSLAIRDLVDGINPSGSVANFVKVGILTSNGASFGVNETVQIPWMLPLLGTGHILICGDSPGDTELLMQTLSAAALRQTEPTQLEVHFYDPYLSGIGSPFLGLNESQEGTIHVWNDEQHLDKLLTLLSDYIQKIAAEIPGKDISLPDYRKSIGFSAGKFRVVVIPNLKVGVSDSQLVRLSAIARAGARVGVSLIIGFDEESAADSFAGGTIEADRFSKISKVGDGWTMSGVLGFKGKAKVQSEPDLLSEIAEVSRILAQHTPELLKFEEVQELEPRWTNSTAKGISFFVGKSGRELTEIRIGDNLDQKHNILITGAVGQGKSNLLNVIIHSLSCRYSPDELELYLLDFKEGITLFPLAPSSNSLSHLPHARVLGLESDREFGLSVLEFLDSEFSRRASIFKPYGDNIEKYRDKAGELGSLPRIVLVIDEFHLLFDPKDDLAIEAARLLERVARLGRAYGIHLILASQTITGISALMSRESGLYSQFPIRIALKNSVAESRATLTSQNDAAAKLTTRGQAVVNRNYGIVEDNEITTIPVADETTLAALRREWVTTSESKWRPPRVFDGSTPANMGQTFSQVEDFKLNLGKVESGAKVFFGQSLKVDAEPAFAQLYADSGRNVAIVGSGKISDASKPGSALDVSVGTLQSMGLALAMQHRNQPARFHVINCLETEIGKANNQEMWLSEMQSFGQTFLTASREEAPEILSSLAKELIDGGQSTQKTYVLGFALDRLIGRGHSGEFDDSATRKLQQILELGPSQNVHVLASWSSLEAMTKQLSRSLDFVQLFLLLKSNTRAARELFGSSISWDSPENRGLFGDKSISKFISVIPFAPFDPQAKEFLDTISKGDAP